MPTDSPHPCKHGCGTMLHPFPDTHRGEPRVYWREADGHQHDTVECWALLGERVARLTRERDEAVAAADASDERRDNALRCEVTARESMRRSEDALDTALSRLRRVRGVRWRIAYAKPGWSGADIVHHRHVLHEKVARPTRAEPLCELARYCRGRGEWHQAYAFASIAAGLPRPDDRLFVDEACYQWRALDELAIAAHWTGRHAEAVALGERLLCAAPTGELVRVAGNLKHSVDARAGQ